MNGKRIHFVVPRYHTNMVPWVKALQMAGAKVSMDVVVKAPTEDYQFISPNLLEQGVVSKFLERRKHNPGINKPYSFPSLWSFFKHFHRLNLDVVVIRDPGRYISRLTLLIALFSRVQIICYNQQPVHRVVHLKERLLLHIFNLVFNSKWISPVLGDADKFPRASKHHFFVPFASKIADEPHRFKGDIINLLMIGKFEERKNHILLLNAIQVLMTKGYHLNLKMIGELSTDLHKINHGKVVQVIKLLHLEAHATIEINVPPALMLKKYVESDVFVLPASKEPASVSVIEALGAGLPVICSYDNGTKHYIKPGLNGYVFEADNLNDLLSSLEKTILDIQKQPSHYYEACWRFAEQTISVEQFQKSFAACLN